MKMLDKKHVLACMAAGAVALGATSLSATSVSAGQTAIKAATPDGTQVKYRKHRNVRAQHVRDWRGQHHVRDWRAQQVDAFGNPITWPFAAAAGAATTAGTIVGGTLAGAGTATGAIIGGTAAALTGNPYGYHPYAYDPYGSYAYAPGTYSAPYGNASAYSDGAFDYAYPPQGLGVDIGHSYYNGFGSGAPASSDNCAVDAGYGRKDYSLC
jgi:hypothetical protein